MPTRLNQLAVKKLIGANDEYRIRVGDYRIVYQLGEGATLSIERIAHRKDVYE